MADHKKAMKQVDAKKGDKEKWVQHYSSKHQILLVGEGDFSFSLCLAHSFGSASNIVASSLDSYDVVTDKYKKGKSNVVNLGELGASILHGLDVKTMKYHLLEKRKFDRIIFNFPHAGFWGKEDNGDVIEKHRSLVRDFFANAKDMLKNDGEIHVTHKTTAPFCDWKIEELARENSLTLIECVDFNIKDYPGYHNKRGDGDRSDDSFPLGECSTFKFTMSPIAKKIYATPSSSSFSYKRPLPLQDNPVIKKQCRSTTVDYGNPLTRFTSDFLHYRRSAPSAVGIQANYGLETCGRALNRSRNLVHGALLLSDFERYKIEHRDKYLNGRNSYGFDAINKLHSNWKLDELREMVRRYGKHTEGTSGSF